MKKILLTFDYEVFFVKFGSINNSLLLPTELLVKKMNDYSMQGTFFVDVLYLDYLKRQGENASLKLIMEQLRWMVASGHRIELHIHPHWLDTTANGADFSRYRLHCFTPEEQNNIFEFGIDMLNSLAQKEDRKYKVLAYRAGGWCIQPFIDIKKSFQKYNIKIDSSVAAGMYQSTATHYFDFRKAPAVEWYRYTDDINNIEPQGEFIEIPITTFFTNPFNKLYKRWIARKNKGNIISYGDGYEISVSRWTLLKKLFERKAMYSIDGIFDVKKMLALVNNNKLDTINFISHPKNLTNFSLAYLDDIKKENLQFLNIYDYYCCLEQEKA